MVHSDPSLCQLNRVSPQIPQNSFSSFDLTGRTVQFLLTNWGVPFWDLARASAHAVVEWIEKGWVLSVGGVWRPRPYAIAIAKIRALWRNQCFHAYIIYMYIYIYIYKYISMIHTSYHHVIHALLFHIIWNPSGEATSLSKKLKLLLFKILGGFTHFF